MASQPAQHLPNELLDKIFQGVDPTDKALCAAICRSCKTGRRTMLGINEAGEVIGESVMYHTVAFRYSIPSDSPRDCPKPYGPGMALLIRTLLEHSILTDQISGLRLDISNENDEYTLPENKAKWRYKRPDFASWPQKLHGLGIRKEIVSNILTRNSALHPRKRWGSDRRTVVLAVLCTKLKSLDITAGYRAYSNLMREVRRYYDKMAHMRASSTIMDLSGICGLESIDHLIHRYYNKDHQPDDVGLYLPALRRLTMYGFPPWVLSRSDDFRTYKTMNSTIEHIEMVDCSAEILCQRRRSTGSNIRLLRQCPALKKLHVVWTTVLEPVKPAWYWNRLARHIGNACEEICFDNSTLSTLHQWSNGEHHGARRNEFSAATSVAADEHANNLDDSSGNKEVCRLGNIKRLTSLRKLRLPKAACVGHGRDEANRRGKLVGESRGVFKNFDRFLTYSLPDDTSQLQLEIVCPTSLLSSEDQALLVCATRKEFKSVTIYNHSKTAWVSSFVQGT